MTERQRCRGAATGPELYPALYDGVAYRELEAWLAKQPARSPLVTGLAFGLFSGGLMLAAQLGNPNGNPVWAAPHFVIWFAFGLFLGRRERRRHEDVRQRPPG